MQNKLQELTDKLYNEGLSKGKQEGEEILAKAKVQAEEIIAKAKAEAEEKLKANKELMDGMAEYSAWSSWSGNLKTQLEEHKKIKPKVYS